MSGVGITTERTAELSWAFFLLGTLHLSPSFTYLFSAPLRLPPPSLPPSLPLYCFFQSRIPPLFPPLPLACPPTQSVLQLYRSGRGCSDPRRRSSESWVVATPYLLSRLASLLPRRFPFIWQTVYIFHRLEILFARSAAKLSRFEIFMNGSLRGLTHGPSGGRTRKVRP